MTPGFSTPPSAFLIAVDDGTKDESIAVIFKHNEFGQPRILWMGDPDDADAALRKLFPEKDVP